MRRDYFTCVFLACIAGALAFVCFKPLYFIYGGIVPREFGMIETILSALYTVFFLVFIPLISAYRHKNWILVGLGFYGILAYIPLWFYPAEELIAGESANITNVIGAMTLRGIYGMVNAPFAAMSTVVGNDMALSFSKWILPLAIIVPFLFKLVRFYNNAYAQEQLNPAESIRHSAPVPAPAEPEILGTVISAPKNAASPAEVSKKAAIQAGETKMHMAPPSVSDIDNSNLDD